MTDKQLERIRKAGLDVGNFAPRPMNDKERIAQLEEIIEEQNVALMELAEIISEVIG